MSQIENLSKAYIKMWRAYTTLAIQFSAETKQSRFEIEALTKENKALKKERASAKFNG